MLDEGVDPAVIEQRTQKCFDEGGITADADANIASIFGIVFPAWTGGVRQFVAGYPGGRDAFVARAKALTEAFGSRFERTSVI